MNIDISQGFAHYSTQELISYSDAGILYCGDFSLSDFIDKVIEREDNLKQFTQDDIDEAHADGVAEGIRRAIAKLEDMC